MKGLGLFLLVILGLAVPVLFFVLAIITENFSYVIVSIVFILIYVIASHCNNDHKDDPPHKENFSDGLTYDEYVDQYGEPKRYTDHWKKK